MSFPFLYETVVKVLFKDFGGAYSSGSVQDFHLIPFSMRFPNGMASPKFQGQR